MTLSQELPNDLILEVLRHVSNPVDLVTLSVVFPCTRPFVDQELKAETQTCKPKTLTDVCEMLCDSPRLASFVKSIDLDLYLHGWTKGMRVKDRLLPEMKQNLQKSLAAGRLQIRFLINYIDSPSYQPVLQLCAMLLCTNIEAVTCPDLRWMDGLRRIKELSASNLSDHVVFPKLRKVVVVLGSAGSVMKRIYTPALQILPSFHSMEYVCCQYGLDRSSSQHAVVPRSRLCTIPLLPCMLEHLDLEAWDVGAYDWSDDIPGLTASELPKPHCLAWSSSDQRVGCILHYRQSRTCREA